MHVFRDGTERKAEELKSNTAAEMLRKANQELQQFAHAVSHDIREPFRNIPTCAELLSREAGNMLSPEARRHADFIIAGVRRVETLLDDLLTYAKTADDQNMMTGVDMNHALRTAIENLRVTIAESQAAICKRGSAGGSRSRGCTSTGISEPLE